jgi:hypothetical protein
LREPVPSRRRRLSGATAPWNSGDTTGSSSRRRASGDGPASAPMRRHAAQCGLADRARRHVDRAGVRVAVCRRWVELVRNRSTTAEMTRPLFGSHRASRPRSTPGCPAAPLSRAAPCRRRRVSR